MKKLMLLACLIVSAILICKFVFNHYNSSNDILPIKSFKPAVEYLLHKRGMPYEEILQYREQQFEALRNQATYRSGSGLFPGNWEVQGPGNIGGMITSVAVNPKNESIIYAGFSEGGVFKTSDGGKNWIPVFDEQTMLSIGCIAIDPKTPNTIYVGTGDPNNGSQITGGNGIYKSVNGGLTWKQSGLQLCRNIAKLVVDAQNPSLLIAAALGNPYELNEHRGLYKSNDGGLTWKKTLFVNKGVGFIDLISDPSDPSTLYASSYDRYSSYSGYAYGGSNSAVYKSTDHGETWKKLTDALPEGKWGRVSLAISQKNTSVLYLSYIKYDTVTNGSSYDLGGIRISTDKGLSWNDTGALNDNSGLDPDCLAGFGWYFGRVVANPNDENDLFLLGVDLWRSFDRGENWFQASPTWWTYEVHADKHDLVFLSDGSFLLATDGGLYKTDKFTTNWEDIENIPCNQFYRVTYLPQYPDEYFGGTQDNGTVSGNKNGFNDWIRLFGGDGFQLQASRIDSSRLFAETQYGNIWDLASGENVSVGLPGPTEWDMPYFISQYDDDKMIAGSNHVYENVGFTTNPWNEISNDLTIGGRYNNRKTNTITTLDESVLDNTAILAGTSNGLVWLRENIDQYEWKEITSNLPAGYITSVKTSKANKNVFYVSLSAKKKNDYSPFVYKSTNAGISWSSIQSDLPMFPVYDVFVYPGRHDSILFAATDIGVYATINAGTSWKRLGENMPFIPVFDLDLHILKNQLIAGTYARSLQTFNLNKLVRENPVGTKDISILGEIEAFPNPCRNQISISINGHGSKPCQGYLFDAQGRWVKSFKIQGESKIPLDIKDLIPGVYLIKVLGKRAVRIVKMEE